MTCLDSLDGPCSETEIRDRAYRIYQSRNPWDGDALSDWLQAERELIAEYQGLRPEHRRASQEPTRRGRKSAGVDRVRSVQTL
jgi:hypothetical protein